MRTRATAKPKVYYAVHPYQSHQRVAADYRRIISGAYDVITDQASAADAGIILLHVEPRDYEALYRKYPFLSSRYVISCCVWEADDLPDPYKSSLSHVQEVWTCSRYCESVLAGYHPNVTHIPYVIERDIACDDGDRDEAKRAIDFDPGRYYFLTITRLTDLRKNAETLVRVFERYSDAMPEARLIVKASSREHVPWKPHPRVTYIMNDCSDRYINGLYEAADAYVSAHHAEGWGLTMSDAMIFRKPVIATEHSGNLEFMNDGNSLLVKCSVETIKSTDRYRLFDGGMKWAYVDEEHLGEVMVSAVAKRGSRYLLDKIDRASIDIQAFDSRSVGQWIHSRLDQIVAECF